MQTIEEIQNRLDSVSDAILFARKNCTFSVGAYVDRLMIRMEHLSVAFADTVTLLHQLEFKQGS